jgi:hypothetical protein
MAGTRELTTISLRTHYKTARFSDVQLKALLGEAQDWRRQSTLPKFYIIGQQSLTRDRASCHVGSDRQTVILCAHLWHWTVRQWGLDRREGSLAKLSDHREIFSNNVQGF